MPKLFRAMTKEDMRAMKPGIYVVLGNNHLHQQSAYAELYNHIFRNLTKKYRCFNFFGNDLHWSKIQTEIESFRREDDGYLILATMNPFVIDNGLAPASEEDLQKRLLFACHNGKPQMLSDDAARHVWQSYDVGIQSLSEILVVNGYW